MTHKQNYRQIRRESAARQAIYQQQMMPAMGEMQNYIREPFTNTYQPQPGQG